MSNLFSSLNAATGALHVFQRSISVTQNNVTNASTPGYSRQRLSLESLDFQVGNGLAGGVRARSVDSARNRYAEQDVWRQQAALGDSSARAAALTELESQFDVTGRSGIPAALNQLLESFSEWSIAPNSATARQSVLHAAQSLSGAFVQASAALANTAASIDGQVRETVAGINGIAARIRDYNVEIRRTTEADPGIEGRLYKDLEDLSKLTGFTPLYQEDGTVTILMGNGEPLVIGDQVHEVQPDAQGVVSGRLAGLLAVRDTVLTPLRGDGQQPGDLNRLAYALAGSINQLLASGQTASGVSGAPLFVFGSELDAASTLRLNPNLTPEDLAAIDPGPPAVSNGIALKLAAIGNPSDDTLKLDGKSFLDFYSSLASEAGRASAGAASAEARANQLLAQSVNLRGQLSGVSLDEEAMRLMEFQRAYQATARMITVVSELTETVIRMLG